MPFSPWIPSAPLAAAALANLSASSRHSIYTFSAMVVLGFTSRVWIDRRKPWRMLASLMGLAGMAITLFAVLLSDGYSREARLAVGAVGAALASFAFVMRTWDDHKANRTLLIFLIPTSILVPLDFGLRLEMGKSFDSSWVFWELLALGLLLTFGVRFWVQRQAQENLTNLAGQLGWQIEVQSRHFGLQRMLSLVGHRRGRAVRLADFKPYHNHTKQKWVCVEAMLTNLTDFRLLLSLKPSPSIFIPKNKLEAGMAVMSIGDDDFDQAFAIQSSNADLGKKILTPKIRRQLLDLRREKDGAFIVGLRNGQAHYAIPGYFVNTTLNELREKMDLVCDLAEAAEQPNRRNSRSFTNQLTSP